MNHGCIHLTISWNNRMLNGVPKSHQGRQLYSTVMMLWKSCMSHSTKMYSVRWTMANMTAQSCSIKWHWLFKINNQNCLSMVSFCSKIMEHLITIMMCKICCNVGAGRCWHILPILQISPDVITGCLRMWKNIFGVEDLNWKTLSTLLNRLFTSPEQGWLQTCK